VSIPGRIDDEMQKRVREARRARAKDKKENDDGKEHAIPLDSEYRSLFTPAGWAFAIWGVIYAGETALVVRALTTDGAASTSGRDVAPWFALACGFQGLWCAAFRPWARKPRHFWVSSALLIAEAFALGGAHRVLRSGAFARATSRAEFWSTHAPLSLHFGWICAAALVNLNSFVAKTCGVDTQLAVAFASAYGAAALGVAVSTATGDALYGCVVAWALAAVASDGGKRASETLGDVPLRALAKAARWSSRVVLVFGVARAVAMRA